MQNSFYYHANDISGADKSLQGKEQLLSEEQKLRRVRARRLIVETNRRRRALEDKQKQRDVREQRLREEILQLRRQKIQEATERFQKAHLHQRFRRNIPTIEEALDEIKSNLNVHRSSKSTLVYKSSPRPASIEQLQEPNTDVHKPEDAANNNRPAHWKNSDSLAMKDSLESPASFFLFDRPRLHVDDFTSSGFTSFFVRRSQQRKLEESEQLHNKNWKCDTRPYLDKQQLFTLAGADAGHSDAVIHSIKAVCGNREFCGGDHEPALDSKQQTGHDSRLLKPPSATGILLPAEAGKEPSMGSSHRPNIELSNSSSENTSCEQETSQEPPEPEPPHNDLNRLSSSQNEKPIYKTLLQQTHTAEAIRCCEEEEEKCSVAMVTCDSTFTDQLMKGILKKQLRRSKGNTLSFCDSDDVVFAKQVALAIRDSVELTRARAKEGTNAVKKKLRWFDQGHEDKHLSQSRDHRAATAPGASRHGRSITTSYHFTKQAWADVGVQVNLPQESEVREQPCAAHANDPAVPWRERCARARAGSVTLRTRKGIAMRPQSATEVSQIAKTQGKMIAPRPPPPRTEDRTPYGSAAAGVDCKQDDANSHNNLTASPSVHTLAEGPAKVHSERHVAEGGKGLVSGGRSVCLGCTPTEAEISELWHSVRSALASQNANAALQSRTLGSDKSRPASGHGNNRPPRSSQLTKEAADPSRPHSNTRLTTTEEGSLKTRMLRHQRPEPSTLSLEEEKILLSLDRLDQQLHRVCGRAGLDARVVDTNKPANHRHFKK